MPSFSCEHKELDVHLAANAAAVLNSAAVIKKKKNLQILSTVWLQGGTVKDIIRCN